SQSRALDLTRVYHLDVVYWPVSDPTGLAEGREARLEARNPRGDRLLARLAAMPELTTCRLVGPDDAREGEVAR
ncbi:MAG: hypothetical protein ABR580_00505, partial [Halomonas sp.]